MTQFYINLRGKDGNSLCTSLSRGDIDFKAGNLEITNISPVKLHTTGIPYTLHILDKFDMKEVCGFHLETLDLISNDCDTYIGPIKIEIHKVCTIKPGRLLER